MATDNRRSYFRLRFPYRDRPVLIAFGQRWTVTEMSEGGLRFLGTPEPEQGAEVDGTLEFADGRRVPVSGRIGRSDNEEIVVIELFGIGTNEIFIEQRRLIHKYPMLQF